MGCKQIYIGQTVTQFNKRYCGHRNEWLNAMKNIKPNCKLDQITDKSALSDHYKSHHLDKFKEFENLKPSYGFDKAYKIVFLEASGKNLVNVKIIVSNYFKLK